jgi:branched-chain amino acid aminotransferase
VSTSRTVACPEGITRRTVLELCAAHGIAHEVRDVSQSEVYAADECFCTGTMGELAGVVRVDGRAIGPSAIGPSAIGPVTRRLSDLYGETVRSSGYPIV